MHHQNWGIYLDDMASGIDVSRNIVSDSTAGFLIGGGRSNTIVDNVINACPKVSIRFDARGTSWAGKVEWLNKPEGTMWQRLNSIPFKTGVWQRRFPYLAKLDSEHPNEPRNNIVTGNQILASPAIRIDKLVEVHGTVRDNTLSKEAAIINVKDGCLVISDLMLRSYNGMKVGP